MAVQQAVRADAATRPQDRGHFEIQIQFAVFLIYSCGAAQQHSVRRQEEFHPMDQSFAKRIKTIDWTAFHTAYGRADNVPEQLLQLASADQSTALKASHDLWCGLCHQHVQVGTAALPALPFLLEVMECANDPLVYEILDIILGFAKGVNRQRYVDFQKGLGREPLLDPEWLSELRAQLLYESHRFLALEANQNADIAELANILLEELSVEV